ncbi:MAG: hypothetical protein ACTSSI_02460 [Candidatus Helarchaeota archaeon]
MAAEFDEMIKELENIFEQLLTRDNTPDQEVTLKMKILKLLSSIKAYAEVKSSLSSQGLIQQLDALQSRLLEWDPFGPWFKEVKELVSSVQDVITTAKKVKFEETMPVERQGGISNIAFNDFKMKIENEIARLRKDMNEIKSVLKSAIKGEIRPIAKPKEKPVAVVIPKVKPVSQPTTEIPPPVNIPIEKPQPKPVELPQPVPITEPPEPEPEPEPQDFSNQFQSSRIIEKAKPDTLFGIFSPNTGPSPRPPISASAPATPKPKPVPLPSTKPQATAIPADNASISEETDSEKLYQELVSLEGRRFALEMGIRDIKQKFESGQGMSEDEYKRNLEEKLAELKQISDTIDLIREKLD